MTKHYNATFTYYGSQITISATIPDSWDVRDWAKKTEAAQYMTLRLRDLGLFGNSCIHSKDLTEVKRREKVTFSETVNQIEQAKENYKSMQGGVDKMLLGLSTVANHCARS